MLVLVADREQLGGQVLPVVDSSVHGDKSLQTGFVFHVGVVETRVEHDDGKRQDVACVCYIHTHTRTHTGYIKPQLDYFSCTSLSLLQLYKLHPLKIIGFCGCCLSKNTYIEQFVYSDQ